jgi:DsbC/DsbD-like thiol-disulfide interchange protein
MIMKPQILSFLSSLPIFLTLCFAWPSLGTVHPQTTAPMITTKLSLTTRQVQRGRSVRATLVIDVPRGYHVNAHEPVSRFALPTKIEVEAPSGMRIGPISYPRAIVRRFTFSEDRLGVYENRAVIRFNIMIPPNQQTGKSEIKARLSYQSCSDEVCFPPVKREISVSLNVS